jgi:anti-anti-sigma regulatory factor
MASNFQIFSYKNRDSLHLKLSGDFDGSSAHELFNTLKKYDADFLEIFIDTNNLKTINSFGIDVFQKKLGNLKHQFSNLIFIGANKHKIAPN